MLTQYLNKLFNRDADIRSMDDKFDAAQHIADPAERTLRYGALAEEAGALRSQAEKPARWAAGLAAIGIALQAAAFVAVGWPLIVAGTAIAAAGIYLKRNIGKDAREEITQRQTRALIAERAGVTGMGYEELEHSPRADKMFAKYPNLRESFQYAAEARKRLGPSATIVPGPAAAPSAPRM